MRHDNEIKASFEAMLAQRIDAMVGVAGFDRRRNAKVYERRRDEVTHQIIVDLEVRPRYAPDAEASILPVVRVSLPSVNEIALQMTGENRALLGGGDVTLVEPFDMLAPKAEHTRWMPRDHDGFLAAGDGIALFATRWVLPFLDEYSDAHALISGYEKHDPRLLLQQHTLLFIAAAYVVTNQRARAKQLLAMKLGSPGLRRRFADAFEFFDRTGAPPS